MKKLIQFPFPVLITKENKWYVAGCPLLNIATQGKTEKEVKENIKDLIKEHLSDPDTPKIKLKDLFFSSLTYIPVTISENLLYGKT